MRNDRRRLKRRHRRELQGAEVVIIRLFAVAQQLDYLLSRSHQSPVDTMHVRAVHNEWARLQAILGPEVRKVMERAEIHTHV